jgi:hypothetical protein
MSAERLPWLASGAAGRSARGVEPIRVGLTVAWSLVAIAAIWNARRWSAARWYVCAGLAAGLASTSVWMWHVGLLRFGQRSLRSLGLYEGRLALKVVLAIVLLFGFIATARLLGASVRRKLRGTGRALVPTTLAVAYVALLTLSLDDFMPRVIAAPPGRFVIEFGLAALALLGAALAKENRTA